MNRRTQTPASPGFVFSKAVSRIALVAVLAVFGLTSAGLHAQSASSLFKRGQEAEARQDYDAAFDYFQKANAKSPKDLSYRTALYRVRVSASAMHLTKGRKLLQSGDEQGALAEFMHASEIDPGNEAAQQEIARLRQKNGQAAPQPEVALPEPAGEQQEIDSIGAPAELKPLSNEPLTLHMTEDAKVIYQAIGKAAGVNVLFDPDYNSKRIQVDLNNVSLLDALRIVGTMSGTFWRPVTSNTIFVAQNTRIKRTELDEQAVQTFYLSNAWQQNDLNDVQTALRNVLHQRQNLRRGQPERHRDAGNARRAAAGPEAHQRPGQGPRRSGGRHRGPRGQQELGADPRHLLAQQRGRCPACRQPRAQAAQRQQRGPPGQPAVPPLLQLSTIWPISRPPISR